MILIVYNICINIKMGAQWLSGRELDSRPRAAGTSLTDVTALWSLSEVSKGAKIRNRYNQVPHMTQDTNGKVTNLQLDTTNESQEASPFPAGDHKAHINRRSPMQSKHKTEKKH